MAKNNPPSYRTHNFLTDELVLKLIDICMRAPNLTDDEHKSIKTAIGSLQHNIDNKSAYGLTPPIN